MKQTLIFLTIFLTSIFAEAQIIENGESNPMWGVRATFDVNMPGKMHNNVVNDRMFRTGTGGAIGAVCNIALGKQFYLEPAVNLFYDTYSYKDLIVSGIDYEESDPSIYKVGLRVPVIVGYSIRINDQFSIAPFTGPELSYAFSGDIKFHDRDKLDANDYHLFGGSPGYQRKVECGWKIGLAFFTGMWSFNIDGTIGMTNLMTNGMKLHENRGAVSVTRYF